MKTIARIKCSCQHEQQDEMYGKNIRIANVCKTNNPKDSARDVRCTVCSKIHRTDESKMR
jgi:hypothetical protein